jgi:hypothetical protein
MLDALSVALVVGGLQTSLSKVEVIVSKMEAAEIVEVCDTLASWI